MYIHTYIHTHTYIYTYIDIYMKTVCEGIGSNLDLLKETYYSVKRGSNLDLLKETYYSVKRDLLQCQKRI
jgi:hypothetical protein